MESVKAVLVLTPQTFKYRFHAGEGSHRDD